MKQKFKRAFLRAPLKFNVLYIDDEYCLKAQILNISEGGLLLENLPHVPEVRAIPLMFPIPLFPELQQLEISELKNLKIDDIQKEIVKVKARVVRSFEGLSDVEKIFVTKVGCEFVALSNQVQSSIANYVRTYAKNLIYFLGLFEGRAGRVDSKLLLPIVADLLGYDNESPVSLLRMKALHDYQSLESL